MTSVHFDQHSSNTPAMAAGLSGGEPEASRNGNHPHRAEDRPEAVEPSTNVDRTANVEPAGGSPPLPSADLTVKRGSSMDSDGGLTAGECKDVATAFKLLADETRLKILSFLVETEELNVRSLCERLDQSQPAVSHHLALMRQAGLIASRRQGKNNFYRLMPQRMAEIRDLVGELFLKNSDAFRSAM